MNKYLFSFLGLSLTISSIASDQAYKDGQYQIAAELYKEKWQESKDINAFEAYIKSLIKLGKYKEAKKEIASIENPSKYLNYLNMYVDLALNDYSQIESYKGGLNFEELDNFIKIKMGESFNGVDDLSLVLNNKFDDLDLIKNKFYKLLLLIEMDEPNKLIGYIKNSKNELTKAKDRLEWKCLVQAYRYLQKYNEPLQVDIRSFIETQCQFVDIKNQLTAKSFKADVYGEYAEAKTEGLSNLDSFNKILNLNEKGVINKGDLSELIKLNPYNSENFEFSHALLNESDSANLFYGLYKKYNKADYLYYSYLSLLETQNFWVGLIKYKEIYFKQNRILRSFIQYLDLHESKDYKNIMLLDKYVKQSEDDQLKIDYAKLIYPYTTKKANEIWGSISSKRSYRYKLFHNFNKKGIVIKSDLFVDDDYLVIQKLAKFRKKNYSVLNTKYSGSFLKEEDLFLRSVGLSRQAKFKEAADLLDYPTNNLYILGKRADYLYLESCLEDDLDRLKEAVQIYKDLLENKADKSLINSLRYKYFVALIKLQDENSILKFLEKYVFETKLNKHNYYDHRLILEAYRYFEQKKYVSFCTSIERKYGISLP